VNLLTSIRWISYLCGLTTGFCVIIGEMTFAKTWAMVTGLWIGNYLSRKDDEHRYGHFL
jgi:hypothetical protein